MWWVTALLARLWSGKKRSKGLHVVEGAGMKDWTAECGDCE